MIYFLLAIGIVLADQGSKYLAVQYLKPISTQPIIENVFHLTYTKNTGAAFSILRDKQLLLIILTSVVICGIIGLLFRNVKTGGNPFLSLALAMIVGGAVGNLIDRMWLNYVIDFFDFRLINFAIFNVADIGIVLGTLLMGYLVIFKNVEL